MPSHRGDRPRSRERERERDKDKDKDKGSKRHSHRDRSASPSKRDREKRRRHSPDVDEGSDDEDVLDLREMGVKEITEEDYFLKSGEYRLWLKDEKGKYLDQLSSESAHKYFRKFVRRWNDGALKEIYYHPPSTGPATSQTGYKWSFASNRSRVDSLALAAARQDVERLTHSTSTSTTTSGSGTVTVGPSLPPSTATGGGRGTRLGPSLPSASDRQYSLESNLEARKLERKAENKSRYEKVDELVPRSGGRQGQIEERRAKNAENKQWRDKDSTAGLEIEEGTLMGESGGFKEALRAREAAAARRNDKKAVVMADRRAADSERLDERRRKEASTMDMFKALAKERFG